MNTREILEKALSELVERGWTTGYWTADNGRVCIEGALIRAMELPIRPGDFSKHPAYQALADVVGDTCLWMWNDDLGRTEDEVLAAFKDAIVNCPLEDA